MRARDHNWIRFESRSDNPRVLIISPRRRQRGVAHALRYEFENVVAAVDDVEFAFPRTAVAGHGPWGRAARRLDRMHPGWGRLLTRRRPRPGRRYDLLLVCVQSVGRLEHLAPWSAWKDLAEVTVCYVDEAFRTRLEANRNDLRILRGFDLVFLGCEGTVTHASQASGRACRHLPFSVDALEACPYPSPPARCIDFYALGRRRPDLHRAVARLCRRRRWYYAFDTARSADTTSCRDHRRQLFERIRRTRYFMVQPALADAPDIMGGQEEIGYRYYEGAASGAVLLGTPVDSPSFPRLFGWGDAVIPVRPDGADLPAVIDSLEADPRRVDSIRRANVVHSLRGHDHAHRWADILAAAGLPPRPALAERLRRLSDRAALIDPAGATAAARSLT